MTIDDRKAPQVPRSRQQPHGPRSAAAPRCRRPAGETPSKGGPAAEPGLTVTVTGPHGSSLVARVTGEIDLRTAQDLRSGLVEACGEATVRLVVDFGGVGFCDATGLGILVGVHNHLQDRGGELVLAQVRPPQLRLLKLTHLDRVFGLYETVAAAVAAGRTSSMS